MKSFRRYPLAYLSALCYLACVGCFFLPLVYAQVSSGEMVLFGGFVVTFGGEIEAVFPSGVYSFAFRFNIFTMILSQLMILGFIASILSKQSTLNRVISAMLGVAVVAFLLLQPVLLPLHSSLTTNGTHYAYGTYICLGLSLLALLLTTIAFFVRPKPIERKRKSL